MRNVAPSEGGLHFSFSGYAAEADVAASLALLSAATATAPISFDSKDAGSRRCADQKRLFVA